MQKLQRRIGTTATAAATLGLAVTVLTAGASQSQRLIPSPSGVDSAVVKAAAADPGRKILVSLEERRLWLVVHGDTVFSAPVAVGKGTVFKFADRTYRFDTPKGERRILNKREDPSWVPPDWHYFEKAAARGLEPVHLNDGDRVGLSDGTYLDVRDNRVGRVNRWGNWWPFTPGSEIVFDGKIFIPPLDSPQRVIPNALGPVKLSLGDGYMIHGTHYYDQDSIGDAASHGCIRMNNEDVLKLAKLVSVGTPVYIF